MPQRRTLFEKTGRAFFLHKRTPACERRFLRTIRKVAKVEVWLSNHATHG